MQNFKAQNGAYPALAVGFVVAAAYIIFQLMTAPSFPKADDYLSLTDRYIEFRESSSASETVLILFKPHNEHNLVFNNVIAYVHARLGIPFNFHGLIIFGSLARVLSFWIVVFLFLHAYREREGFTQVVVPAAFFFFQLKTWQANSWAMMTLCSNFAWLFGFAAVAVANRSGGSLAKILWCFVFSTASALTHTTGIPSIAVAALLLFVRTPKTRHRIAIGLLLFVQALFIAYLLRLSLETSSESAFPDLFVDSTLLQRGLALVQFLAQLIGHYWLGNSFSAEILGTLSLVFGSVMCLAYIQRKTFELLALYVFVVSVAAIIAAGRYSLSADLASEWRFKIFTEVYWLVFGLMLCALLSDFLPRLRKNILATLGVAAAFYSGFSYAHFLPDLLHYRESNEKEIRDLAIGLNGIFDDGWFGSYITENALKAQRYEAVDFSQAIHDYAKPKIVDTCESDGYAVVKRPVQKIGTDDFEARYFQLQATLGAKRYEAAPDCVFRSCVTDPIQSVSASSTLLEMKKRYEISAIADKSLQTSEYSLLCR